MPRVALWKEGKSGLLVDGHDPHDWATALGELIFDDARRIAMAEYAPVYAREFSWEHTAEKLRDLYQSLPPMPPEGTQERHPAG